MSAAADHSKTYVNVLAALAVGTLLTVAAAQVHFGHWGNIAVGLMIATIKASLVVMFFMHLKYEQRWWAGLVLFPVLLVLIIIGSNLADTGLNGKNRDGDLLSEPLPVIPHAGHAGPAAAPAHH
jgi:cytochrome c oxidase subunit 4